jgi:hypothetical protein
MKTVLTALIFAISFSVNAKIIEYVYEDPIYGEGSGCCFKFYDALGYLSVDTETRRLVSFDFWSEIATFSWSGEAALKWPEQIRDGYYSNSFDRVFIDGQDVSFFLYLDVFYIRKDQDLLENLELAETREGADIYVGEEKYYFSGNLSKLTVAKVPEPATFALLALGLAAIAIRSRPR